MPGVKWRTIAATGRTIKILGVPWKINRKPLAAADGMCYQDRCRIVMERAIESGRVDEVMLHEVIHALLTHAGLAAELGPAAEERICERLSPLLVAVMRDNLVRWDY